ncbi:lasso peptide biosynthesis PqqD family chaperone [Paenibacillus alkalitolerans]|uniref:lasso peptide biosynthesis PqqD family chaperone n=1 Tax=Paenibacillus alkalitolerans TaxID=2799335 RepID=UPI0018F62BAD|nr:lasso peptide biosynthesis PqqD family chaperone [Paenibacillus alkalitolerans]
MTNLHLAEQTIVQAEGYIVSDMNGEKVMMSVNNGKYYNLGKIGGRIWELLASPTTVNNVIDTLVSEYEVDRKACEDQVNAFLQTLHKEALIEVRKLDA